MSSRASSRTPDALRVVEAGYAAAGDEASWLAGIVEAAAPFGLGGVSGLVAYVLDFGEGDEVEVSGLAAHGEEPVARAMTKEVLLAPGRERIRLTHTPTTRFRNSRTDLPRLLRRFKVAAEDLPAFSAAGVPAMEVVCCGDERRVLTLVFTSSDVTQRVPAITRRLFPSVLSHLGAAVRLRARSAPAEIDAWLSPSGKVLEARNGAEDPRRRASLVWAVQQSERARGALRRTAPDEALALWRGLVQGTWSIVDTVESDGKRVVLARRNRPEVAGPAALSQMESVVAYYAAAAHSYKQMAYALGISESAVARHLRSAMVRLGVRSRTELARLYGIPGT